MKIGIFGGTFDPIHFGHLQLARNARVQFSLDKVIFVPAFQSPHKQDVPSITPAAHRYEMVRIAIESEPHCGLSDSELKRQGISYTFDTLIEFEKQYPGAEFFLILGKDAFEGLDAWHRAPELKQKVRFIVAKRENHGLPAVRDVRADWIQMPLCPISASGIRAALKRGESVDDYLSPKVLQYIRTNELYRKDQAWT